MRPHWELAAAVMLGMNRADPRILNERGEHLILRVRVFMLVDGLCTGHCASVEAPELAAALFGVNALKVCSRPRRVCLTRRGRALWPPCCSSIEELLARVSSSPGLR